MSSVFQLTFGSLLCLARRETGSTTVQGAVDIIPHLYAGTQQQRQGGIIRDAPTNANTLVLEVKAAPPFAGWGLPAGAVAVHMRYCHLKYGCAKPVRGKPLCDFRASNPRTRVLGWAMDALPEGYCTPARPV